MPADERATELAIIAARAAAGKLGEDIVALDVADRLALTDIFLIVTGVTERQVHAIVDEVEEQLRLAGAKSIRREGLTEGRWVLLDYGDIIVHVQHAEDREFYGLEKLWNDCPEVELHLEDLQAAGDASTARDSLT